MSKERKENKERSTDLSNEELNQVAGGSGYVKIGDIKGNVRESTSRSLSVGPIANRGFRGLSVGPIS